MYYRGKRGKQRAVVVAVDVQDTVPSYTVCIEGEGEDGGEVVSPILTDPQLTTPGKSEGKGKQKEKGPKEKQDDDEDDDD